MQPLNPKLEIASRVLAGLITQDRNRQLKDRLDDIRHSLEVATELIRQGDGGEAPTYDHKPRLTPAPTILERKIERVPLPWSETPQGRSTGDAPKPRRGPTLH